MLRRLLLWLALASGVLLLAAGIGVLLVDTSALSGWAREYLVPRLEERIGREVALQAVDIDLFPSPGIVLEGVRVAGGGPQPLLASERVVIHLAAWPLIRSRGRDVRITGIQLVRPELTLLRSTSGTWDFQEPLARMQGAAPGAGTERTWAIDRLTIQDGLVRLVDSTAQDGGARVELQGLEATVTGLGAGRQIDLRAEASLQSATPNVRVKLQLDALPTKGAPLPPAKGRIDLDRVPLALLRPYLPRGATTVVTGGTLSAGVAITTQPAGSYVLDGAVHAPDLRLRGQPATAGADLAVTIPARTPDRFTAELRNVRVRGPGVDLAGAVTVRGPRPSVRFDASGPLLDLDALLGSPPGVPEAHEHEALLSPSARRRVQEMDLTGTLAVDRVGVRRLAATGLRAQATLQGGTLRIERGIAGFYGGTADLSGTTIDLSAEDPAWHLRARLAGVQLGSAMQSVAGTAPLSGKLGGAVSLEGVGTSWPTVSRHVTGTADLQLDHGAWSSLALSSQIASALRASLGKLDAGALVAAVPAGSTTTFDRLAVRFRIRDGWMALEAPLELATSAGTGSLTGRVGLDHRLDLRGTIVLSQDFVSQLTNQALRRPAKVPLVLSGTLAQPQVSGVDATALAEELLPRRDIERFLRSGKALLRNEARR